MKKIKKLKTFTFNEKVTIQCNSKKEADSLYIDFLHFKANKLRIKLNNKLIKEKQKTNV